MSNDGLNQADVAKMHQELAEHEAENLSHGDLIDLLIDGCEGYSNMDNSEIYNMYMRLYLA